MPRIVIGLLLLALTFAGIPVFAEILTGRVVGVHDGDTLTLLKPCSPLITSTSKSRFAWQGLIPSTITVWIEGQSNGRCGAKHTCGKISSRDEAWFYPNTYRVK